MADSASGEITALLRAWHAGDEDAYRQAWDVLYKELRHQAARRVRARPVLYLNLTRGLGLAPDDGART